MARLIKLVKLFRAFKAAAVFSELRILIKTLLTSMMALTWSGVLLSFIMLFSGLVMAQLAAGFIDEETNEYDLRKWTYEHYGSGSRAFYTLFEATLSGGWPNYARPLIEHVHSAYAIFWLCYVLIVVFAVMRVVSALFLQNTLKMASADDELMHLDKMNRKAAYISKLKDFLAQSDADGSGTMDQKELASVLHLPDIQSWLDVIGLESHEVMGLFHVLDDGHGEITHEELLGGMMKLSGGVRAIDSVLMQRDMKRILKSLDMIPHHVAKGVAAAKPVRKSVPRAVILPDAGGAGGGGPSIEVLASVS
jgi:Ca2+-binding EF-hand superfamily protein